MNNINPLALVGSWSGTDFMNEHPLSHYLITEGKFPKNEAVTEDFIQAWETTTMTLFGEKPDISKLHTSMLSAR